MNRFKICCNKYMLPSTFEDARKHLKALQHEASASLQAIRTHGIDLIVCRYAQGRTVEAALSLSTYGDETVKVLAERAGCHWRALYDAHRFYRAVRGQMGDLSDDALRAWCYRKEEEKGRISWNYCKNWAQKALTPPDESSEQAASENALDREAQIEGRMRRIEEKAGALEGDVLDLAEEVRRLSAGGRLTGDVVQSAYGVIVKGREVARDARRQSREIVLERPARMESPAYLAYIREMECLACGAPAPCHAHHLSRGGTGTKGPDVFTVPLCGRCHRRLHDVPEWRFWHEIVGTNPWKAACEFMLAFARRGAAPAESLTRERERGGQAALGAVDVDHVLEFDDGDV